MSPCSIRPETHNPSRSLARAIGVGCALLATSVAAAVNKNWNTGDGQWSTVGNWSPVGLPGAADAVFLGNMVAAQNDWVNLDVHASIASITVTDGMMIDADASRLIVGGDTLISGENHVGDFVYPSRIRVDQSAFALDFVTDDLTVADDGWFEIENGATARVNGVFTIGDGSLLLAEGFVELLGNGPVAMVLDGSLQSQGDGLVISQLGDGLIDLDGTVAGDHTINLTGYQTDGSAFSSLTINGDALTDEFNDDVWMTGQSSLDMNLADGWSMGSSSTLRIFKNSDFPGAAVIDGGTFTMKGFLNMSSADKEVAFDAPVHLEPTMTTEIGPDGHADFNAAVVVAGGAHVLDLGADIDFNGSTTVTGGTFVTFSDDMSEGSVDFAGSTTWNGDVVVDGIARQIGNATVFGPTTIDATRFDLDGNGATAWSIGNSLTVNAMFIDTGASVFDGSMSIEGTFLGKLTVNLGQLNGHWYMDGTMDLGGVGAILVTRLAGEEIRVRGDVNVSGRVQSTADVRLMDDSTLTFATGSSAFRLAGTSLVEVGAVVVGTGALEVASGGDLTLESPLSIGAAGLVNGGVLRLGALAGKATVDRFTQGSGGAWHVDIGGHVPGIEHDFMTVSDDEAVLDGQLVVEVIDAGGGLFEPAVGDEFTILAAPGTITGGFDNQPVSFVPGLVYLWDVAITASDVTLSLGDIVPCPGDINGDGVIDGADLGLALAAWGPCAECDADVNFDGVVDGADLGIVLAGWGACQF